MSDVEGARESSLSTRFLSEDYRRAVSLLSDLTESVQALRAGDGDGAAVTLRLVALHALAQEHAARAEAALRRVGSPALPSWRAGYDRCLHAMMEQGRRFHETGDAKRLWTYVSRKLPSALFRYIQAWPA